MNGREKVPGEASDQEVPCKELIHQCTGALIMSKERSSSREAKKKPAKTMSEKKAEKRAKKEGKSFAG